MYSNSYLPKTGAVARNIITAARISGATVSPEIKALKDENRLDSSLIPEALTSAQIGVIQQVLDWNGRGVIVSKNSTEARALGLISASLLEPKTVLVITTKTSLQDWQKQINSLYPQDTVVQYTTKSAAEGARWVLVTLTELLKSKMLSDFAFDVCINEDITPMFNLTNRSEGVAGVAREIRSMINLVAIDELKCDANDLYSPKGTLSQGLANLVSQLWGTTKFTELMFNLDGTGGAYLRTRGYLSVAPMDLFPTMGVFTALLR